MTKHPAGARVLRSPFAQRVGDLVLANLAAQLIAFAALPILTRIYSPAAFGVFSTVLAFVLTMSPLLTMRLDWCVQLPARDSVARALYWVGLACGMGGGLALLGWLLWGSSGLVTAEVGTWARPAICALAIGVASFALVTQLAYRTGQFRLVASQTVWQAALVHVMQIGFPVVGATASATTLLWGASVARLLTVARVHWKLRPFLRGEVAGIRHSLRRYWRFPAIFAPSSFLNSLGANLPLLMMTAWFGPAPAGLLAVALRIGLAPSQLLGSAVSRVFMAEISSRNREGTGGARPLYLRASLRLLIAGLGVGALLTVLVPLLLSPVLGGDWEAADDYVRVLGVAVVFNMVAGPLSAVFIVYERALLNVALDMGRLALMTVSGWFAFTTGGSPLTVVAVVYAAYSLNQCITWGAGLWVVGRS